MKLLQWRVYNIGITTEIKRIATSAAYITIEIVNGPGIPLVGLNQLITPSVSFESIRDARVVVVIGSLSIVEFIIIAQFIMQIISMI